MGKKKIIRDTKGYYMIKVDPKEDITILNVYGPNYRTAR